MLIYTSKSHVLDVEMACDEVCVCDGVDERDAELAVLGGAGGGPVLRTLDLHLLHQIGQHHYRGHIVVPDHAPKVPDSVGKGTLGCDVLVLAVVALEKWDTTISVCSKLNF